MITFSDRHLFERRNERADSFSHDTCSDGNESESANDEACEVDTAEVELMKAMGLPVCFAGGTKKNVS